MNEVITNIITRRSIRKYIPEEPIEREVLEQILIAGLAAPSAGNVQPWKIYVVANQEIKEKLEQAAGGQAFVGEAPVVVVVCGDQEAAFTSYGERGVDLFIYQDTAALTQNILLAANSFGVGSCWVGSFNEDRIRTILGLDDFLRPLAMITLGYFEETPEPRGRKSLTAVSQFIV